MQLKCSFCSTPFSLSKEQVNEALEAFKADKTAHYDAYCPKCRRAIKVTRRHFQMSPIHRRMLNFG